MDIYWMKSSKIIFHISDEQNRAVLVIDSGASEKELARNLNKLGPGLVNTICNFIPYSESCNDPPLQNDQNENKTVLQPLIAK